VQLTQGRYEKAATLREIMLRHIGSQPQRALQIFEAVRVVWGPCLDRRLWRALRWLVDTGKVRRHGQRCAGATYAKIAGVPSSERQAAAHAATRVLESLAAVLIGPHNRYKERLLHQQLVEAFLSGVRLGKPCGENTPVCEPAALGIQSPGSA